MGTVVIDTDVSGVDDGDALHVEMLVGAGSKVAAWHVRVVRTPRVASSAGGGAPGMTPEEIEKYTTEMTTDKEPWLNENFRQRASYVPDTALSATAVIDAVVGVATSAGLAEIVASEVTVLLILKFRPRADSIRWCAVSVKGAVYYIAGHVLEGVLHIWDIKPSAAGEPSVTTRVGMLGGVVVSIFKDAAYAAYLAANAATLAANEAAEAAAAATAEALDAYAAYPEGLWASWYAWKTHEDSGGGLGNVVAQYSYDVVMSVPRADRKALYDEAAWKGNYRPTIAGIPEDRTGLWQDFMDRGGYYVINHGSTDPHVDAALKNSVKDAPAYANPKVLEELYRGVYAAFVLLCYPGEWTGTFGIPLLVFVFFLFFRFPFLLFRFGSFVCVSARALTRAQTLTPKPYFSESHASTLMRSDVLSTELYTKMSPMYPCIL